MYYRLLSLLLIFLSAEPAWGTTYRLGKGRFRDDNPYGYLGAITTDGTTGAFTDASAITDWSITLWTSGEVDGVFRQVLTPENSVVSFTGPGKLDISSTSIDLPYTEDVTVFSTLAFEAVGSDENLSFISPRIGLNPVIELSPPYLPGFSAGSASIYDASEIMVLSGLTFEGDLSVTVAIAIPEPSTAILCCLGASMSCMVRRTQRLPAYKVHRFEVS